MTNDQFEAWMHMMGLSVKETSEHLGIAPNTVRSYAPNVIRPYRTGKIPKVREPHAIPRHIALACRAIANNMRPWGEDI